MTMRGSFDQVVKPGSKKMPHKSGYKKAKAAEKKESKKDEMKEMMKKMPKGRGGRKVAV